MFHLIGVIVVVWIFFKLAFLFARWSILQDLREDPSFRARVVQGQTVPPAPTANIPGANTKIKWNPDTWAWENAQ